MNLKEIEKIEDFELRSIRLKYWNLRHKAFLNEQGIPDAEIANVFEKLYKKEAEEVEEYKRNQNCQ